MKHKNAMIMLRKYMDYHHLEDWKSNSMISKTNFGICFHFEKIIKLSKDYTRLNTCRRVLDTILHEIAHAKVGWGCGHNLIFKLKCIELGAIPRTHINPNDTVIPKRKYKGTCINCGYEAEFSRKAYTYTKHHTTCLQKFGAERSLFKITQNY